MKKVLAILLSVCLLLPTLLAGVSAAAETGYELYRLDYKITGLRTAGSNGTLITQSMTFAEPLNLNRYGYSAGTLALQLDLFTSGNFGMIENASGQIEFTSSGGPDKAELSRLTKGNLQWKEGEWVRQVIPLSTFNASSTSDETFDPTKVNFFRIYFVGVSAYAGEKITVKVCNLRLVDTSKSAPSPEEDPIGDGSFVPDPPQWRQITVADGFDNTEVVVAGYNLADYVSDKREDYAPVIQSLVEGLELAGGGTLFIPAGHYPCRSPIAIPNGVTLYGEWKNPEQDPAVTGTVLDVYYGKEKGDSAFITMNGFGLIQNMAVWYPEQNYTDPDTYTATVLMKGNTTIRNFTMVNPYQGAVKTDMSGCSNLYNVYGTPLNVGVDMDGLSDIGRFNEVHFAPDYWINSGLPGAPAEEEQQRKLRSYLSYYGVGCIMRRIDWSYLTFIDVIGYANGLVFEKSFCSESFENGVRKTYSFPNGHCYGLTFENCGIAVYAVGISGAGEMMSDITVKNCNYGFWISGEIKEEPGNLFIANSTIDAKEASIYQQGVVKLAMHGSTVSRGQVLVNYGVISLVDNVFTFDGPQVILENGACSAVLVGNVDGNGKPVTYENDGLCPVSVDDTDPKMGEIASLSAELAGTQVKGPAKKVAYLADLDVTGETDVTAVLQALLTQAGNAGGGTVFLKPGFYRMDGSVTVPSGVELKGAFDQGRVPYRIGTVINVYGGKGDGEGTPTVILSENSGIRSVAFDYPEQRPYSKEFVAYPYAIQGRGSNVYVINTSLRNGWNGLDLMTYRCDGHYVDAIGGICYHNSIRVGGGSEDGVIRNYQFNFNAAINGASGWGFWPNSPTSGEKPDFEKALKSMMQTDGVVLQVGNTVRQTVFNCFSYAGGSGVQLIEENGKSPDVLFVGHGCDFTTNALDIRAAEEVQFVNLQLTAFGSDVSLDKHDVRLADTVKGKVTVTNLTMWSEPASALDVQGGELQVNGCNFNTQVTPLASLSSAGKLRVFDAFINRSEQAVVARENLQNVFLNGGFFHSSVGDTDKMGQFDNLLYRVTRWDAPDNAVFDQTSRMLFTESFSEYDVNSKDNGIQPDVDGQGSTAGVRNGVLTLKLTSEAFMTGLRHKKVEFRNGTPESLYRLETRINLFRMRDVGFSQVVFSLVTSKNDPAAMATLKADGTLLSGDGTRIGSFRQDTWYRIAFEIDLRDPDNKTYRVVLMDDEYRTVASGSATLFEEDLQGSGVRFNTVWIAAGADMRENPDSVTEMGVDYVFATYGDHSTFGSRGDVDGDGKVTSTDARLALQYSVGKIADSDLSDPAAADADGDGKITSTDARLILQYSVGKIKDWP